MGEDEGEGSEEDDECEVRRRRVRLTSKVNTQCAEVAYMPS